MELQDHPHRDDAPHATDEPSLDAVRAWRDEIHTHPALTALRAFNDHMGTRGLDPEAARAFIASLYAFNRATPAGITHLAARWADALQRTDPRSAHRVAAHILAAAVDELGLAGTRPHVELFIDFGSRWGVTPAEAFDAAFAVPSARALGDKVGAWYRTAPLTESLAIHFVSEETSAEEFAAWYRLFPDEEYTRVHAQLEPGHSDDAGTCLARHLAAHPGEAAIAHATLAPYLALYGAMWTELAARCSPAA